MSGRCPDPYCAGYSLRRACARDQMNLVLTNLKPRTKQCAICVKLRDGVVSRLSKKNTNSSAPCPPSNLSFPAPPIRVCCRGQICGDNPQSADHHPIPV